MDPAYIWIATAVAIRIFSNSYANVFQKQLTNSGYSAYLINFFTYGALSVVVLLSLIWVELPTLVNEFWFYAILASLAGAVGNAYLIKALKHGALSVLGPINAYKSVVGMLIGLIMLGEKPGVLGLLGVFLIIGGSYLVLDSAEERFGWQLFRRVDIQYRLIALVLTGIEAVLIKRVIVLTDAYTAFVSWCAAGALVAFVLVKLQRESVAGFVRLLPAMAWKKLLLLVTALGVMQWTTNYTLARIPVGYALALFQLSILLTVILGNRLFNEGGLVSKLIGAVIMMAGAVLIIFSGQ